MLASQRNGANFPVQYLGANVPQAWAAGSCFALLQAMLGIQPDAPNDRLYVDPDLPAWLPDVTLTDLRLGRRHLDIRFRREGEQNSLGGVARRRQGRQPIAARLKHGKPWCTG